MLITGLNSTVTLYDEKTADSCQKQSAATTIAETADVAAGKNDAVTLSKEALLLAYQNKSPANSAEGTDDDLVDFVELMFGMMQRYHEESLESAEKTSRKHREEQLERMAAAAEEQQAPSEATPEDTGETVALSARSQTSASGDQVEGSDTDISSAHTDDTANSRKGRGRHSLLGYSRHNTGESADFRIRGQV